MQHLHSKACHCVILLSQCYRRYHVNIQKSSRAYRAPPTLATVATAGPSRAHWVVLMQGVTESSSRFSLLVNYRDGDKLP